VPIATAVRNLLGRAIPASQTATFINIFRPIGSSASCRLHKRFVFGRDDASHMRSAASPSPLSQRLSQSRAQLLRGLVGLVCAGVLSSLLTIEAIAAESLLLQEAVQRSLASNPLLAAEAADLRSIQARAERAGMPSPYIVGGELENFAGSGDLRGMRSSETTLRLGRVLELGGKQAARQALGTAEVDRQRNMADAVRLDIASRTTARFIEVAAGQQRLDFAREQVQLAERTRREVSNWVRAGRNPESDLGAAEITLAEAELELGNAERELESAKVSLAAMWGAMTPDFQQVSGDLSELSAVEPFETLAARLPMTAAQRSAALAARVAVARRQVAQAGLRPDVNVSVGVRRVEALDDNALVMSLSVPLGNKPRASLAIEEANADYEALVLRREAQLGESHRELFEKYQELMHARTEYEALHARMIPKADQALQVSRRGFDAGRFSFLSLAQAQRTLFDLRKRAVAAATRYHVLLVEIERLTTVFAEPQS